MDQNHLTSSMLIPYPPHCRKMTIHQEVKFDSCASCHMCPHAGRGCIENLLFGGELYETYTANACLDCLNGKHRSQSFKGKLRTAKKVGDVTGSYVCVPFAPF